MHFLPYFSENLSLTIQYRVNIFQSSHLFNIVIYDLFNIFYLLKLNLLFASILEKGDIT